MTLMLEEDLLEKFDALAAREDRSRAAQLRWMMRREVERATLARTPTSGEDATAA